jgi:hypothetical protein
MYYGNALKYLPSLRASIEAQLARVDTPAAAAPTAR